MATSEVEAVISNVAGLSDAVVYGVEVSAVVKSLKLIALKADNLLHCNKLIILFLIDS